MQNICIRPSRDIRNNYAQISELSKDYAVAITVNGKEDTIVLSHENYLKMQALLLEQQERLLFYEKLARAEDDVKLGRVVTLDTAFETLIQKVKNGNL